MTAHLRELVGLIVKLRHLPHDRIDAICKHLERGPKDFSRVQTSSVTERLGVWSTSRPELAAAIDHARGIDGLDPHEFAAWLRTAAESSEQANAERQIELVGTGPSPSNGDFRSSAYRLLELIGEASQTIWIATYTLGSPKELQSALRDALDRNVRIRLLCDRSEDGGGSSEILDRWRIWFAADLLARIEFFFWPRELRPLNKQGYVAKMHVKSVVVDRFKAIVTSANLTEEAHSRNMEFGVVLTGGTTARQIHDRLESMVAEEIIQPFDPSA